MVAPFTVVGALFMRGWNTRRTWVWAYHMVSSKVELRWFSPMSLWLVRTTNFASTYLGCITTWDDAFEFKSKPASLAGVVYYTHTHIYIYMIKKWWHEFRPSSITHLLSCLCFFTHRTRGCPEGTTPRPVRVWPGGPYPRAGLATHWCQGISLS